MTYKQKLEERFGEIRESKWIAAARDRKANRHWLKYSQEVAFSILEQLDQRNITQKAFAEKLNISPQLVSKWLKGNENFTLETIAKIETVLGIRLVQFGYTAERTPVHETSLPSITEKYKSPVRNSELVTKFSTAVVIPMPQTEYLKIAR